MQRRVLILNLHLKLSQHQLLILSGFNLRNTLVLDVGANIKLKVHISTTLNSFFEHIIANLLLKVPCAGSIDTWLYEKSALGGFCGIATQECKNKRRLMPFRLPYLLPFLQKKSQETYQHKPQANSQKALTTGTRKISVKVSVWNQMAKSWSSVVMRLCPSGVLGRGVLPFDIFIVFSSA